MENVLYAVLLAVHNVVLVVLTGGLYVMWLTGQARAGYPQTGLEVCDRLYEQNILAHPQGYLRGLIVLALTGGGMPLVHFLYHGNIKVQTIVSSTAVGLKLILVMLLFIVLYQWAAKLDPRLNRAFQDASQNSKPENLRIYFALAAGRVQWMKAGWILALLVLLATPFITYFQK